MCEPKIIKIEFLRGAKIPCKATEQSAGFDVFNICNFEIKPGEQLVIPTGFKLELPKDTYAELRIRSSAARSMIRVEAGIIDNDYHDEIMILLHNYGKEIYAGVYDRRIIQMIVHPFQKYKFVEGKVENGKNGGRTGGFGSTGQ